MSLVTVGVLFVLGYSIKLQIGDNMEYIDVFVWLMAFGGWCLIMAWFIEMDKELKR